MKLFFLLLTAFTFQVRAEAMKIAVITSEFDENQTNYFLKILEDGKIDSMRYVTIQPNGGIFEDITLPAERVLKEGAVIVERNGYEVVQMELENFNVASGGTIKLKYLYNGVNGARHIKKLLLKRIDNQFQLFDQERRINRMFLATNRVRLLGIVGVKEIQTSFVSP